MDLASIGVGCSSSFAAELYLPAFPLETMHWILLHASKRLGDEQSRTLPDIYVVVNDVSPSLFTELLGPSLFQEPQGDACAAKLEASPPFFDTISLPQAASLTAHLHHLPPPAFPFKYAHDQHEVFPASRDRAD